MELGERRRGGDPGNLGVPPTEPYSAKLRCDHVGRRAELLSAYRPCRAWWHASVCVKSGAQSWFCILSFARVRHSMYCSC